MEEEEDRFEIAQTAHVSLKETVSLMSQLLKGGIGFGHKNCGKLLDEDTGRKGASDTIQQVENQITARERRKGKMIFDDLTTMG